MAKSTSNHPPAVRPRRTSISSSGWSPGTAPAAAWRRCQSWPAASPPHPRNSVCGRAQCCMSARRDTALQLSNQGTHFCVRWRDELTTSSPSEFMRLRSCLCRRQRRDPGHAHSPWRTCCTRLLFTQSGRKSALATAKRMSALVFTAREPPRERCQPRARDALGDDAPHLCSRSARLRRPSAQTERPRRLHAQEDESQHRPHGALRQRRAPRLC